MMELFPLHVAAMKESLVTELVHVCTTVSTKRPDCVLR